MVSRYFGGIKLGAGGLVRAYGSATQQALELTPSQLKRELQEYRVQGGFSQEQRLRHWLTTVEGEMASVAYGEKLVFQLILPAGLEQSLVEFCAANQLDLELPWRP